MSNTSFSIARPTRMLLAALSVVVVSGCASSYPNSSTQQQAQYVLNNDPATLLKDVNLNEFLSKAPAGSVLNLERSPWGESVEIVADAPYLAASGRECRRLRIVDSAGSAARDALTCDTPDGWVNQRVFTEMDSTMEGRY